jgi:hypothetical protein
LYSRKGVVLLPGAHDLKHLPAVHSVSRSLPMSVDAEAALPGTNYTFDSDGTLVNVNTGAGFAFTTQAVRMQSQYLPC